MNNKGLIRQKYKIGDCIADRFEIHNIFGGEGETGMGIVYFCYDHTFKQPLALKTFQDKYLFSKTIKDNFKIKIVRLPEKEDLVIPIDEHLIVELYSK